MTTNDFTDDLTAEDLPDDQSDSDNVLEQLRAELSREIKRDNVEIAVTERDGVSVVYSPNFKQRDIRSWRRKSGENSKSGFDSIRFACHVVGKTCEAIKMNGQVVTDGNGEPLNFVSREILEMVDEDIPIPDGIQKFFVLDPHLEATAMRIIEEAGWSDEVEVREDPTMG